MTFLFSVLLYPVFFILMYAVGEYIFDSRNLTLAFSILSAFIISYLYFCIRERINGYKSKKNLFKEERDTLISRTMLLDKKTFQSLFPGCLCNNSTGINEDQLLDFLRKNGTDKRIDIYSLNGMTKGCYDLLAVMQTEYTEHTVDEILCAAKNIELPEVNVKEIKPRRKRIKNAILSKAFRRFSFKYGFLLILTSIISPYKVYYIVFGSALMLYSAISHFVIKISQRNQIPYLQS